MTEMATGAASEEWLGAFLRTVGQLIEIAGVGVILLGALVAAVVVARDLLRGGDRTEAYDKFRAAFARAILLGLEFLVAADIIGTVLVEPTLENLAVLGLIVLIRTFLSFSLELEIEGRWPWQKPRPRRE